MCVHMHTFVHVFKRERTLMGFRVLLGNLSTDLRKEEGRRREGRERRKEGRRKVGGEGANF